MHRANPFILILLTFIATGFPSAAIAAEKIQVFVSILPQKYFVEQIGRDSVDISVMVAPHQNPENFEPLPSQMAALSKADIYFAIGVPFEDAWLKKFTASYPRIRLVRTDAGIAKKPIRDHADSMPITAAAGLSSRHHHEGVPDPHIWLSPELVRIQSRHIRDALTSVDPARNKHYEANFTHFIGELTALDQKIKTIFAETAGDKKFLVFHPSWGYFADAYGLTQLAIEIEGKEPKAQELKQLIDLAARHHIQTVFVQPQFSSRQAEIIAQAINGRVDTIDPLAANWNENLLRTAAAINASFLRP
jgi:zinc transport system substrate-binding protein